MTSQCFTMFCQTKWHQSISPSEHLVAFWRAEVNSVVASVSKRDRNKSRPGKLLPQQLEELIGWWTLQKIGFLTHIGVESIYFKRIHQTHWIPTLWGHWLMISGNEHGKTPTNQLLECNTRASIRVCCNQLAWTTSFESTRLADGVTNKTATWC